MWLIALVLLFSIFLGIIVFVLSHQSKKTASQLGPTPTPTPQYQTMPNTTSLSQIEKDQIDAWIDENNLNEYGDPIDTNYAGGTPLFDETTGETLDRYDYIISQHPDSPWIK